MNKVFLVMHWILVVGYRECDNGEKYLQIVNGWNNTSKIFLKLNLETKIFSARKYNCSN